MFEKSLADRYDAAVKRLQKAEVAHRKNLDALDAALQARQAHQVTPLRQSCEKSERELQEALQAAAAAHRAYWTNRRDDLRDELDQAAVVIAEFNALARLAGDMSANPALQRLQAIAIEAPPVDVLVDDGVPTEAPDCALLDDYRGSWR